MSSLTEHSAVTTLVDAFRERLEAASGRTVAIGLRLPARQLPAVIASLDQMPSVVWQGRDGRWSVGLGEARRFEARTGAPYEALRREVEATLADGTIDCTLEPPVVRVFGGFSFDQRPEVVGSLTADFILPQWTLHGDGEGTSLTFWGSTDLGSKELLLEKLHDIVDGFHKGADTPETPLKCQVAEGEPTLAEWRRIMGEALTAIRGGSLSKVVLARRKGLRLSEAVTPPHLGRILAGFSPGSFKFVHRFTDERGDMTFLGGTPERLVRLDGVHGQTEAVAGTIPLASKEVAADFTGKDRHEQAIVADAIREWLAPFVKTITTDHAVKPHQSGNVAHLKTHFDFTTDQREHILALVERLHPTPAVAGMPRAEALRLLATLEPFDRKFYAAPVGWFDRDGNGEFCVALRCCEIMGTCGFAYAGAGIVADSDPDREFAEIDLKFDAVRKALGAAS